MKNQINKLIFIMLSLMIGAGVQSQNVIDLKKVGAFTLEELISFNIPANNAVEAYKIIYSTKDYNHKETKASGLILIPVIDHLAKAKVVIYHHGATLIKNLVPSNVSFQADMTAYFASNGYVTLAPDYLGLGDGPGIHPYMHAETEATASVDMIRAVRKAFKTHYQIDLGADVFSTGYSQGGHASMAFQKYVEENNMGKEFNILGNAPAAGPYDMLDITFEHVLFCIDNYGGYDSEVLVCLFASYQEIYGDLYKNLSEYYIPPYDSVINAYFESGCTTNLNAVLPKQVSKFMYEDLWKNVKVDKDHPLNKALKQNNVYNWKPVAPLKMFHSKTDEMISIKNAYFTLEQMKKLGAKNVSVEEAGNDLGHNKAMPVIMKKVLEWFNSLQTGHK